MRESTIDTQAVSITMTKKRWDDLLSVIDDEDMVCLCDACLEDPSGEKSGAVNDAIDTIKTALIEKVNYPIEYLEEEPAIGSFIVDADDDILVRVGGFWVVIGNAGNNSGGPHLGYTLTWDAIESPRPAKQHELDSLY